MTALLFAHCQHPFSQWYHRPFNAEIGGRTLQFKTAEQYMMARKALLFDDSDALKAILTCTGPKEAKAIGRRVVNFDVALWNRHAKQIVIEGNRAKFSQHDDLRKQLISTAPRILAEAAKWDRIWGIGMDCKDPRSSDPKQWIGSNWLGECLMAVRDELSRHAPKII